MSGTASSLTRRGFLGASSAALVGGTLAMADDVPATKGSVRKPRVAAINSIYRLRSHAYHIAGRFIYGYTRNGFHHQPPFELVRMWNHQQPKDDLGPLVCKTHKIELTKTIPEALGANGRLDVDAVLLII